MCGLFLFQMQAFSCKALGLPIQSSYPSSRM